MKRIQACVLVCCGLVVAATAWGGEIVFKKTVVDKTFRSEGVAVGDVNHDGKLDILAGDVWYEAPDWKMHEIRPVGKYKFDGGYSNCFAQFARDVNGDGWVDTIIVGYPGKEGLWYENPKGAEGHWKQRVVSKSACNETPLCADLLGDGQIVPVWGCGGTVAWFGVPKDIEGPWDMHALGGKKSAGAAPFSHGLGVGDVNKDGRNDVLINTGWWEAPADRTQEGWTFHPAKLGPNCADLVVYDVDGDGDNDVISSSAHAYGIWWHEQVPGEKGPEFKQHEIFKEFSQTHAVILADINRDGVMDFVTGKRFYAHNGGDPGAKEPAVLYWFELRRPEKGKVEFIPHKIDDDSGVGTQFVVCDFNADGLLDVVVSNKKGVCFLLQQPQEGSSASAQPLFDGKSFEGWEGNLKMFRIADGAIVGGSLTEKIAHNDFLCTTKEYGDFELKVKAKAVGKGVNAGIQFRSRRVPKHYEVSGYQADIGSGIWGTLYDESRRNGYLAKGDPKKVAEVLKPDDWNECTIRCQGPRIQLFVNGLATVDYTEADEKIPRTGIIGLQIHGGGPSEAWYKDITIRPLP